MVEELTEGLRVSSSGYNPFLALHKELIKPQPQSKDDRDTDNDEVMLAAVVRVVVIKWR